MSGALPVVAPALIRVAQRLIGEQQDAHALLGILAFINIRVKLQRQLFERGFDCIGGRAFIDA